MKRYDELITVIVPVYNTEKYLNKCIDSIIVQTYENLEIILVDDGSTDNSGKICDEYAKKDSRIKVIHKENEGVSVARNTALDAAEGKYIGFVDSDDYIEKTMYEVLYENIVKSQADISVCGFWFVLGNKKKKQHNELTEGEYSSSEAMAQMIDGRLFAGHLCNKLFKAEYAKRSGFEQNIYVYEDMLYVWKYLRKCNKLFFTTQPLYYYIMREGSACHNKFDYRQKSALLALDKMVKDAEFDYAEIIPLLNRAKVLFIITGAKREISKRKVLEIIKTDLNDFRQEIKEVMKKGNIAPFQKRTSLLFAKSLCVSSFVFKLVYTAVRVKNKIAEGKKNG